MMHFVVYWLLCIVVLFISAADVSLGGLNEDANMTVNGSCKDEERQALLTFKADLKDIDDTLTDWSNEKGKRDCCQWLGIYCDNGHVIELRLSDYHFVGKINLSIKVLKQLQTLDLSGNDFQSNDIPNFLGSFTNLEYLYMSNANLNGPIPREIGSLSNLNVLDLSNNSLVGFIPFSFQALTSLIHLNLSVNHLWGSVPNFTGLSDLLSVSLAYNSLNGTIPDFTGCESLRELDLSGNQLSGDLPKSVGQLSNLEYIDVSSNSLHGVISDLHFINLSSLTYLDMSFNSFSFELSSHFTVPFQLETIKLQSCKLGPTFPLWIKTQTSFQHLDISGVGISDGVPVWFWDLPRGLKILKLSSNELRGTLPDITSNFDECPGLDLSNNRFEGRVPLLPSKLASLQLSGNKFNGGLSFLCHFDGELTFIDLSDNSFSGSLPDCWSQFQKLVVLDLSNNYLSGKISLSFGFLNQLEALYFRNNNFVGELPISMSNCTNLRFVDVGENKLSGKIPAWVGERLTRLYGLVLRSNMLSGSLPNQICWLYNLHILDLSKNRLVGNIPRCFGNLTSMSSKWSGDYMTNHSYQAYHSIFENDMTNHSYQSYHSNSGNHMTNINYNSLPPSISSRRGYNKYNPRRRSCTIYNSCSRGDGGGVPTFDAILENFIDNALVAWQGTYRSFVRGNLELLKIIDLSNNSLSGELPFEITRLVELVSLNISLNKLNGELPKDIGNLTSLNSLDLSRNQFSGKIPPSLSQLDSLGALDLSYNNFSGKIPTGTLLQGFNASFYEGNPLLYGPPLTPISGPTSATTTIVEEDDDFWKSYYMGMGAGFAVGFWGICSVIFFNRRCRHLLFASLSHTEIRIYVTIVVLFRKFKRF